MEKLFNMNQFHIQAIDGLGKFHLSHIPDGICFPKKLLLCRVKTI